MFYAEKDQISALVKNSRHILIIFKQDWTGDALASSLALKRYLSAEGKASDIVCQDFKPAANLQFLPLAEVSPRLEHLQQFTVSIDCHEPGIGNYYLNTENNKLLLNVSPKSGKLSSSDVSIISSGWKYDLIYLIGTPDLSSLGEAFANQPDFFYATPKINIDSDSRNERFGNINLVNVAACSTAEIICQLIREDDESLIDADIATALYAGMVTATRNFKSDCVTPQTLNLAGWLISRGARRDQIVTGLYRSRFLSTLKLWGRILSRLENHSNDRLVSSFLSQADFLETQTTAEEIDEVVDELLASLPKAEIVAVLHEDKIGCRANVYSLGRRDAIYLCRNFNPIGNKDVARLSFASHSLTEAKRLLTEELQIQM